MTQRERESVPIGAVGDIDPHSLLFGDDDDELDVPPPRQTRADRRRTDHARRRRVRRRRGRLFVLLTAVIIAAVTWLVVPRVIDYFRVADYSGDGSGSVTVTVRTDDSAGEIAATLRAAGVVKSTEAFTDAAAANSKSQSIQPGVYNLHRHMSGKAALAALLDPRSRNAASDVLVPEGATSVDVAARLVKLFGSAQQSTIDTALHASADLGVPVTYKVGSRFPVSAEGFLYPATYTFDPGVNPRAALGRMVSRFITQDRDTGFATDAKAVGLTPYQALIVASIAQAEAKFATDMPKVVRAILNRLNKGKALQVDPPSVYAAKLNGVDPTKIKFSTYGGPYNTYLHTGLPPTPIDNPGAKAMAAAVHPASGNWIYYVNKDAAGHLFFTGSEKAFAAAQHTCFVKNWGCADS